MPVNLSTFCLLDSTKKGKKLEFLSFMRSLISQWPQKKSTICRILAIPICSADYCNLGTYGLIPRLSRWRGELGMGPRAPITTRNTSVYMSPIGQFLLSAPGSHSQIPSFFYHHHHHHHYHSLLFPDWFFITSYCWPNLEAVCNWRQWCRYRTKPRYLSFFSRAGQNSERFNTIFIILHIMLSIIQ